MARLDTDGDGSVSFPEFCAWWDVGLSMEKLLHPSFGKQLARVIRVHHRHKPDELWDVDDDLDLAA